jgi:hypothetical protein
LSTANKELITFLYKYPAVEGIETELLSSNLIVTSAGIVTNPLSAVLISLGSL